MSADVCGNLGNERAATHKRNSASSSRPLEGHEQSRKGLGRGGLESLRRQDSRKPSVYSSECRRESGPKAQTRGAGPAPGARELAGTGGAGPRGAGSRKFSAETTQPLRRAERSPPGAARLPRPRLRVQVALAAGLAGPRGLPGPSDHRGLQPAPSAPLPTASSGLRARPAGEGTGRGSGEVGGAYLQAPCEPRRAPGRRRAGRGGGPRGAPSRCNTPVASELPASAPPRPRPGPGAGPGGAAPNQRGGWAGAGRAAGSPQLLRPITLRLAPGCTVQTRGGARAPRQTRYGESTSRPPCAASSALELTVRAGADEKWRMEGEAFLVEVGPYRTRL